MRIRQPGAVIGEQLRNGGPVHAGLAGKGALAHPAFTKCPVQAFTELLGTYPFVNFGIHW